MEEQDRLVKLPCKSVFYIVDEVNPKYAFVMSCPIKDLRVNEIEKIDKDNHTYIKCDEELVGGTGHGDEYCLSTYICTKCGKTINLSKY